MEKDIIIQEDNYTGTINERYKRIGQEVDTVVTGYVQILSNLANANMEGELAGELSDFAEETARLLAGMMEPKTTECAEKQIKFIGEIEAADQ